MNQILLRKAGTRLYHDYVFSSKKPCLDSVAVEASCYVCGKGLDDGYRLTAKSSSTRILLFCSKHS